MWIKAYILEAETINEIKKVGEDVICSIELQEFATLGYLFDLNKACLSGLSTLKEGIQDEDYTTTTLGQCCTGSIPFRGKQAEQACRNSWVEDRGLATAPFDRLFLSFSNEESMLNERHKN